MKLTLSQITFFCLWIMMETRMEKYMKKKVQINQKCILTNCLCEDCLRTDAACELNISAYGYRYHFHGLRESPNQILLKRFYVKKPGEQLQEEHPVEYIRCDVIPLKNEKKLKCMNTTIWRGWTLPDPIKKNVLNVIQNC